VIIWVTLVRGRRVVHRRRLRHLVFVIPSTSVIRHFLPGLPFWQPDRPVGGGRLPRCVPPSRFSVAGTDRRPLP
jgi:hypothetical protein